MASMQELLVGYSLDSFDVAAEARRYAEAMGFLPLIDAEVDEEQDPHAHAVPGEEQPYAPVITDLARLHWLALSRRAPCVLEFGSGYSTLVLAHAMALLSSSVPVEAQQLFRQDPLFHVHSVDEDQRFADVARSRIPSQLQPHVSIRQSGVEVVTFQGRIATLFSDIPDVSPTLIYLDGPSQFASTGSVNGFTTRRRDAFPMAADILAIEHFLAPGTLIAIDGRAANARFLQANLQRAWVYRHQASGELRADIHLFELQEAPLGSLNRRQLEYCLPDGFLLSAR